jgi:hypothetical protein
VKVIKEILEHYDEKYGVLLKVIKEDKSKW